MCFFFLFWGRGGAGGGGRVAFIIAENIPSHRVLSCYRPVPTSHCIYLFISTWVYSSFVFLHPLLNRPVNPIFLPGFRRQVLAAGGSSSTATHSWDGSVWALLHTCARRAAWRVRPRPAAWTPGAIHTDAWDAWVQWGGLLLLLLSFFLLLLVIIIDGGGGFSSLYLLLPLPVLIAMFLFFISSSSFSSSFPSSFSRPATLSVTSHRFSSSLFLYRFNSPLSLFFFVLIFRLRVFFSSLCLVYVILLMSRDGIVKGMRTATHPIVTSKAWYSKPLNQWGKKLSGRKKSIEKEVSRSNEKRVDYCQVSNLIKKKK